MTTPSPAWCHPSSIIDEGAEIGPGTRIWHFCHISSGAKIGANCSFGQNAFVASGVIIGDGVKVQNNVSLYTGCVVEDDVFLGPSCVLTNVTNPRAFVSRRDEYRETRLRRGCSIGANATIVCGVEVGEYAFVGAGAVVTKDVPAFAQMVGTPARQTAWRCRCGERLADAPRVPPDARPATSRVACGACGTEYRLVTGAGQAHLTLA